MLLTLGGTLQQQTQALASVRDVALQISLSADQAETTHGMLIPNVQNVFRDFNGTEEPEKARAWIRELEMTKTINGWSEAVAFSVAKAHLKKAVFK